MLTWTRLLIYVVVPLGLAIIHLTLDTRAVTHTRKLEVCLLYWFAIAVGANGLGGFVGHFFLSDIVAAEVGWPAGNPFQLEQAFGNLIVGILGILAMSHRDGFRTATIIAAVILSFGATIVHIRDIIATGNLAPGNTIQNIRNLLGPVILMTLAWTAHHIRQPADVSDEQTVAYQQWHDRQMFIAAMAAAGVGTGFGVGFMVDWPLVLALVGALLPIALITADRYMIQKA